MRKLLAIILSFLFMVAPGFAQMAAQYQQAAQAYNNAAARCSNPAGAACYRLHASYYSCLAAQLGGGGSCGSETTCTVSCGGTGASVGPTATTANNNANNLIQLGGSIISLLHSNSSQPSQPAEDVGPTPEELAAQAAAAEAARQQQINNDAANILQEANSLVAANGPPSGLPHSSDSTTAVSALLGDGPASPDPAAAVTALLDGSPGATTTAVAGLLDNNTVTDSDSAFPTGDPAVTPDPPPTSADTAQEFSAIVPPDPAIAEAIQSIPPSPPDGVFALSSEVDTPNPSPSLTDQIQDGLQGAISSVKQSITSVQATLGSLMNTPTAQTMSAIYDAFQGKVPLPTATDTPEQLGQKSSAQSVVGFSSFIGTEPHKGLWDYWNKNYDQTMGDIGYATGAP
jgi:hypothetical protein